MMNKLKSDFITCYFMKFLVKYPNVSLLLFCKFLAGFIIYYIIRLDINMFSILILLLISLFIWMMFFMIYISDIKWFREWNDGKYEKYFD